MAVLSLGIDVGIVSAVVGSLMLLVYQNFYPRVQVLGFMPSRPEIYMDVRRFPAAVQVWNSPSSSMLNYPAHFTTATHASALMSRLCEWTQACTLAT